MPASQENQIDAFLAAIQLDHYVGASFAYVAWRRDTLLRNLACRIVLRPHPPALDWAFRDDVDDLVIRRGWMPAEAIQAALGSLHVNQIVLGDHTLTTTRDQGNDYMWTHLLPGSKDRTAIGWRAHSLFGLGENQTLLLTSNFVTRLDAKLRGARHPFDGWSNLAAFLGEGAAPVDLVDRANTHLECIAPIYARIRPESSLRSNGSLTVWVHCPSNFPGASLRLMQWSGGAARPQALDLSRRQQSDTWQSVTALHPSTREVKLTLMLGDELADEVTLKGKPNAATPVLDTTGKALQTFGHIRRWWKGFATVAGVVAVLIGFQANLLKLRTFLLSFIPPQVELAWLDGLQPRIGEPITLDPRNVEPETRRVRFPLLIAIRNNEPFALKLSTLELSVGDTILLRSVARAKLQQGQFVREHDGMTLQPSRSFMPLSQTDTLVLPIEIGTMGWLALTDKKLPVIFPWIIASRQRRLLDTATVVVNASLFFEDRPQFKEQIHFTVAPLIDPQWPNGRGLVNPSALDRNRFTALAREAGQDAARWTEVYPPTGDTVAYRRSWFREGGYQAFAVNRVLRYVAADTNRDGRLDFELLDMDGDGSVDKRALTRGVFRRVILWGPEIVRVNQRANANALLYMAQRISRLEH